MFTRSLGIRALGPIAALAIAVAACASGTSATTAPTASAPPPTTAASTSATAPTSSPTSSASTVQAIPDGTYETAPMSVADIVALINADTKLTAAQKLEVIGDAYDIKLHTTSAVLLDLHGGRYKEGESLDGGNFEVGTRGPYAFPDAHTLVLQEDCCPGITTFQVTAVPNGFSLKRTSAPQDEKDAIIGRILFQSAPFTLAP